MRAMGLDVGTKTIGVAISDELRLTAQPVTTLRAGFKKDVAELSKLVVERGITDVVVGLPLHMNGDEGERAKASRVLGEALRASCGAAIIYWDERLTTVAAERSLLEANVSRKKRKEVIDQVAASLILQSWLDSQRRSDD